MRTTPLESIVRDHHRQLLELRARAAERVGNLWDAVAAGREPLGDAAQREFARAAAATMTQLERQTAVLAARELGMMGGRSVTVDPAEILAETRRGVTPVTVYSRPHIKARVAIAQGAAFADAMRIGRSRAVNAAATDIALTNRAAADRIAQMLPRIVGWRRVLTGNSCLFCATASTQRYHRAGLAPLHPACDCGLAPIIGTQDPGQIINRPLLDRLKALGPEYWQQRGIVDPSGNILFARRRTVVPKKRRPPVVPDPVVPDPSNSVRWDSEAARDAFSPLLEDLRSVHELVDDDLFGNPLVSLESSLGGAVGTFVVSLSGDTKIRILNSLTDGERTFAFLHEYGHRLDWTGIDGQGSDWAEFGSEGQGAHATAEMFHFLEAANDTPLIGSLDALRRTRGEGYVDYLKQPAEIWARAYSQYAANRIGGTPAAGLIAFRNQHPEMQWPDDEFEPLAPFVEAVLRSWLLME